MRIVDPNGWHFRFCGQLLTTESGACEDSATVLSVVIPLYNEGSHLGELLADLKNALQGTGCRFEVVLVDDGSSDDTWERLRMRHGCGRTCARSG